MIKAGKEILRWFYWYPLRLIVQQLSLKQVYVLCRTISALMVYFSPRARSVGNELLLLKKGIKPGSDEFKSIVLQSLFVYTCNELEVLYFPELNKHNIKDAIQHKGIEYLDQVLSKEKGVILLFAHFGANQMIMPALGHLGYKINQIAGSPLVWNDILADRKLTIMQKKGMRLRWELEQTLPASFIDPFSSLKRAFKSLEKKEILALTIDGGAGDRSFEVEFFNQKVSFPIGSIDIAVRTGCPVLPVFMIRNENGFNTLIVEPPMLLPHSKNKKEIIEKGIEQFVRRLEVYTAEHPDHYLNFLALRRQLSEMEEESFYRKT
jgi:KDO2-lipid IV(A) lauroyltransferase